jgi:hypothetical protein
MNENWKDMEGSSDGLIEVLSLRLPEGAKKNLEACQL